MGKLEAVSKPKRPTKAMIEADLKKALQFNSETTAKLEATAANLRDARADAKTKAKVFNELKRECSVLDKSNTELLESNAKLSTKLINLRVELDDTRTLTVKHERTISRLRSRIPFWRSKD